MFMAHNVGGNMAFIILTVSGWRCIFQHFPYTILKKEQIHYRNNFEIDIFFLLREEYKTPKSYGLRQNVRSTLKRNLSTNLFSWSKSRGNIWCGHTLKGWQDFDRHCGQIFQAVAARHSKMGWAQSHGGQKSKGIFDQRKLWKRNPACYGR